MKLGPLHHFTVRVAIDELPVIERFYAEVLGLRAGFRPNFPNEGLWLYDGERPVLHVATGAAGAPRGADAGRGPIDHVAFRASGAARFMARLRRLGVPFEEQNVPHAGYQIFIRDPVGTKIELNFDEAEAPGG